VHAQQNFGGLIRLGHVILGPGGQGRIPGRVPVVTGYDQERQVLFGADSALQLGHQRNAMLIGQMQVDHHQVGSDSVELLDRFTRRADRSAVHQSRMAHHREQKSTARRVIIHDQDTSSPLGYAKEIAFPNPIAVHWGH
jgi:hypothetical protein